MQVENLTSINFVNWKLICINTLPTHRVDLQVLILNKYFNILAEATPKAIQKRMKVRGLTLNHIKSHLQVQSSTKYSTADFFLMTKILVKSALTLETLKLFFFFFNYCITTNFNIFPQYKINFAILNQNFIMVLQYYIIIL